MGCINLGPHSRQFSVSPKLTYMQAHARTPTLAFPLPLYFAHYHTVCSKCLGAGNWLTFGGGGGVLADKILFRLYQCFFVFVFVLSSTPPPPREKKLCTIVPLACIAFYTVKHLVNALSLNKEIGFENALQSRMFLTAEYLVV